MTQSSGGPSLTTIHQDAHRGKMAIYRKKAGNWLWEDKLHNILWFVSVSYGPYLVNWEKGNVGFFGSGKYVGLHLKARFMQI